MEYKYLAKNDLEVDITKISELNNSSKYAKILNNLLSIQSRGDQAVFTKESVNFFDLNSLLDKESINTAFTKSNFRIKITQKKTIAFLSEITNAKNANQILESSIKNEIPISLVNKKGLTKDFDLTKKILIEKAENDINSFLKKWKLFQLKINNLLDETNIWPLYIGTYFLKLKTDTKTIYAPFILKEVSFIIENNEVFLISKNNSIILNDKLAFLLEESLKIKMPKINNSENIDFKDLALEIDDYLQNTITKDDFIDLTMPFQVLEQDDVINTHLEKTSGFCLMICQPQGSKLREVTYNLIAKNKIEDILTIDILKDYQRDAMKSILNGKKIIRIQNTDASQEKAIAGALESHCVIIGPPGTGKSQTIANLLANILYNNKKALFISQKKVALQVVADRMEELKYFILNIFENTSENGNKEDFYTNLQGFKRIISEQKNDLLEKIEYKTKDYEFAKPLFNSEFLSYYRDRNIIKQLSQSKIDSFYKFMNAKSKFLNLSYDELLKRSSEVFEKIKIFNDKFEFENFWINFNLNINEFAKNIKYTKNKKRFFGLKKEFDHEFKQKFENLTYLKNLDEKNILSHDQIILLMTIKDFQDFKYFLEFIKLENQKNKLESNYNNDYFVILKKMIELNTKKILDLDEYYKKQNDPKFIQKFYGRIDRSFALPYKFISIFKEVLKYLFPIYSATPEVLSSFIDFDKDHFDYIIFDEASQIFLEKAIPYLAIGQRIIVVGDDQQMQPSNFFNTRYQDVDSDYEESIDDLLTFTISQNIPKYTLESNYRSSSANLMTFSSKEFYNSKLKTIDKNNFFSKSALEVIELEGEWKNSTNEIEANELLKILNLIYKDYKKIIILTFNIQQMNLISDKIFDSYPELFARWENGSLIIKNLENVQGDEADLVIASIAYTKDTALYATYVGRPGGRNALNVAITRAKEKFIILKSLKSSEMSINENNFDLLTFKNWIKFLELNEIEQKNYLFKVKSDFNAENSFKNDIINWIKTISFSKEIEIKPEFLIGSYKIDIAIFEKNSSKFILGIEIDDLKIDTTLEKIYDDKIRQDFIKSKGYLIYYIGEMNYKINKNIIKKELIDLVN